MKCQTKLIAIDVDGCICEGEYHEEACTPIPEAREACSELSRRGWSLCYHTSRSWHNYNDFSEWLESEGFPGGTVVMGKPGAMWYVDDRALNPALGWNTVLGAIGDPE